MLKGVGLLSLLIWLPIFGGLVVLALGDARARLGRWLALLISLATFVLSIPLFTDFDGSTAAMQFVERQPWIGALQRLLLPGRRRHRDAADPADDADHGAGGHLGAGP